MFSVKSLLRKSAPKSDPDVMRAVYRCFANGQRADEDFVATKTGLSHSRTRRYCERLCRYGWLIRLEERDVGKRTCRTYQRPDFANRRDEPMPAGRKARGDRRGPE